MSVLSYFKFLRSHSDKPPPSKARFYTRRKATRDRTNDTGQQKKDEGSTVAVSTRESTHGPCPSTSARGFQKLPKSNLKSQINPDHRPCWRQDSLPSSSSYSSFCFFPPRWPIPPQQQLPPLRTRPASVQARPRPAASLQTASEHGSEEKCGKRVGFPKVCQHLLLNPQIGRPDSYMNADPKAAGVSGFLKMPF